MENVSYTVHSFMHGELGLSGGELLIFAIIHSFTKGNVGLFYGSIDYLSKMGGISISTVKRALKSLLGKGYIEKTKRNEKKGYRATKTVDTVEKPEDDAPPNEAEFEVFPDGYDSEDITSPFDYMNSHAPRPKYEFHKLGTKTEVKMTTEQYMHLLKLVSPSTLFDYIYKLEELIKHRGFHPKSHYKTIKKWIYEDAGI